MSGFSWPSLEAKLSWDGLLTFFGGLRAFYVIWRQTRHADRGLAAQLAAAKEADDREKSRRIQSVAKAILFEIDDFYRYALRDPANFLQQIDPQRSPLPSLKPTSTTPFPVFNANADKIGEMDNECAEAIIHFYGVADSFLRTMEQYRTAADRIITGGHNLSLNAEARTCLSHMKESLPEIVRFTFLVCRLLCERTGMSFEWPRVAVAAEPLSLEEIVRAAEDQTPKKSGVV